MGTINLVPHPLISGLCFGQSLPGTVGPLGVSPLHLSSARDLCVLSWKVPGSLRLQDKVYPDPVTLNDIFHTGTSWKWQS